MKATHFGLTGATVVMFMVLSPASALAFCLVCSCSVDVAPVAFGTINPLAGSATNTTGDVTVTCGPIGLPVGYDIQLSRGGSGTYAARTMTSGAHTLTYNLYKDGAHTEIWGDGGGGSAVVSNGFLIGLGATSKTDTIYARAPAAPTAWPGVYTDTITATIVW